VVLDITKEFNYNDLVQIDKNTNGDITFISLNSPKSNYILNKIPQVAKSSLDKKLSNGVKIPALTLLGIDFLSGYGKKISINIASTQKIDVRYNSQFIQKGINQTLHRVYLDVDVYTDYVFILKNESRKTNNQVLLCESVIIGKIPDVYFN
jgi:sporulation protein YunB